MRCISDGLSSLFTEQLRLYRHLDLIKGYSAPDTKISIDMPA